MIPPITRCFAAEFALSTLAIIIYFLPSSISYGIQIVRLPSRLGGGFFLFAIIRLLIEIKVDINWHNSLDIDLFRL